VRPLDFRGTRGYGTTSLSSADGAPSPHDDRARTRT
jgi:hypothetical protein